MSISNLRDFLHHSTEHGSERLGEAAKLHTLGQRLSKRAPMPA